MTVAILLDRYSHDRGDTAMEGSHAQRKRQGHRALRIDAPGVSSRSSEHSIAFVACALVHAAESLLLARKRSSMAYGGTICCSNYAHVRKRALSCYVCMRTVQLYVNVFSIQYCCIDRNCRLFIINIMRESYSSII